MSLQEPPRQASPSRLAGRIVALILFAAVAGIVIYTSVTNQRIDLTEDRRTAALELEDSVVVDGIRLNVVEDDGGPEPVVILHDVDVTGGVPLEDLSGSLDQDQHGVRIDLPGFGYSDRIPDEGPQHTVAGMADMIAAMLDDRYPGPVLLIGVGLGGEVGAEVALTHPEAVSAVVMVDVDFWARPTLEESLQRLPWVGRAATYTWETGGRYALRTWAPNCGAGGWCPTDAQAVERSSIIELEDTTDSFWAFRRTPEAALAPANLADITVPGAYVWSTDGEIREETVDRISEGWDGLLVFESDSFAAQLEDPASVVLALTSVTEE